MTRSFLNVVTNLHRTEDPQYARMEEGRPVEYCFVPMSTKDIQSYERTKEECERIARELKGDIVYGDVEVIVEDNSLFEIDSTRVRGRFGTRDLEKKLKEMVRCVLKDVSVKIVYQPDSGIERQEIRRFFEGLPMDGGKNPRPGETFFCYD